MGTQKVRLIQLQLFLLVWGTLRKADLNGDCCALFYSKSSSHLQAFSFLPQPVMPWFLQFSLDVTACKGLILVPLTFLSQGESPGEVLYVSQGCWWFCFVLFFNIITCCGGSGGEMVECSRLLGCVDYKCGSHEPAGRFLWKH